MCIDKLVDDPEALTALQPIAISIETAGSQGVELMAWIAARGALPGKVRRVHGNYHVPISNTASCLLVLEQEAAA